jgi:hypothetical protein
MIAIKFIFMFLLVSHTDVTTTDTARNSLGGWGKGGIFFTNLHLSRKL